MYFERFKDIIIRFGSINTFEASVEIGLTVLVSFALGLLITTTYKKTYRGFSYSQDFAQILTIVCIIISLIISVIGTNIARAFSLAGALSIIRFRSAVQAPRDIAFIFFSMGAGLACGAGLYIPAVIFVLLMCLFIILFQRLNFASTVSESRILKITVPENMNYEGMFDDILGNFTEMSKLQSVKTINSGTVFEVMYHIKMKSGAAEKAMLDEIRARNGNFNVALMRSLQDND